MARRRTTFGKLQRDRDKQAKAKAKMERRQARAAAEPESGQDQPSSAAEQERIMSELAQLHAAYDNGDISLDELERRREELTNALKID